MGVGSTFTFPHWAVDPGAANGTRLARNWQSQRVIMKIIGNRDPRMSIRYIHAAEENVREALNELG